MRTMSLLLILGISVFFLFGCNKETPKTTQDPRPSLITVTQPQQHGVEMLEETVGSLESTIDPILSAEVSGKIESILVNPGDKVAKGQIMATIDPHDLLLAKQAGLSEVKRLEALLKNQSRNTARFGDLLKDHYVSQSMLDEALSQETVLQEQLNAAKANLIIIERNVAKTKIRSPVDAHVESQLVSTGSYVKIGDPLFQIVGQGSLRAHLPFPESIASRIKTDLKVRLWTPTSPNDMVEGIINDIKPMTGAKTRSLDVIVEIENKSNWKPGSSVNAQVITANHSQAITVPEQSVVLRPAGSVVYVINDGKAVQKVVQTGVVRDGFIEITAGLLANDTIAVDGAGFLTDQALVQIQKG